MDTKPITSDDTLILAENSSSNLARDSETDNAMASYNSRNLGDNDYQAGSYDLIDSQRMRSLPRIKGSKLMNFKSYNKAMKDIYSNKPNI